MNGGSGLHAYWAAQLPSATRCDATRRCSEFSDTDTIQRPIHPHHPHQDSRQRQTYRGYRARRARRASSASSAPSRRYRVALLMAIAHRIRRASGPPLSCFRADADAASSSAVSPTASVLRDVLPSPMRPSSARSPTPTRPYLHLHAHPRRRDLHLHALRHTPRSGTPHTPPPHLFASTAAPQCRSTPP